MLNPKDISFEMWVCPKCNREFNTLNQSHSCAIVKEDELFIYSAQHVFEIYTELKKKCAPFCDINIDTTKSCLYFVHGKRFLVIKPGKISLKLEFVLPRKMDVFPVTRIHEISKFRYVHFLSLDHPKDINEDIIHWIREAYELSQT